MNDATANTIGFEDVSAFRTEIVGPTIEEYLACESDRRRAYFSIWSVDAYASHISAYLSGLRDFCAARNDVEFKKRLRRENQSFNLLSEASNATKHAVRDRGTIMVASSRQVANVDVSGWVAWVAGNLDHRDWGERVVVNAPDHGAFASDLTPLLNDSMLLLDGILEAHSEGACELSES